jgi:hypothetical protein
MKNKLKYITTFFSVFVAIWFIIAFITQNYNIYEYSPIHRAIMIIFSVCAVFLRAISEAEW